MEYSEYCSILANIMGIRFYSGFPELQPMLHVILRREPSNIVDSNAILVITKSGKILGHIEKKIAAVLASIFDNLPELFIKRYEVDQY